jgi:hypothetical protein
MNTAGWNSTEMMMPAAAASIQQRSVLVGALFAVLSVVGAFISPDRFYAAYLLGFMLWVGLSLGCLALVMLIHMTGGDWGQAVRRILEAGARTLPMMAMFFIPVILGMRHLYVWAQPDKIAHDKHLQEITRTYLNPTWFVVRAVIYFAIWIVLSWLLNKWSAEQDNPPAKDTGHRFRVLSGPGLVLYAFTLAFAAIDWVMSLNPSWISTIYGLLFLAGECLSAVCFVVVIVAILHRYRPVSEFMKADYVHDYGKLMLTFIMVWAYFSFSQWLIIWAGNQPEEISWYLRRLHGGWKVIGLFLALFHFAVPFAFLLSRPLKRNVAKLVYLAIFLMLMRYVDMFWYIEPTFHGAFAVSWLDIVVPIAIGGFWLALFFRNLKQRPLLPLYDVHTLPVLEPAHHG